MRRLRRCARDRSAVRDALVRWQGHTLLHILHEQVEGLLRVRLYQLQSCKSVLVRLYVVAILHFV